MQMRDLRRGRGQCRRVPWLGTKQAAWLPQPVRLSAAFASRTGGIRGMTRSRSPRQSGTTGKRTELRLPALEVRQGPKRTLYSFAVDGKDLPSFTTISRVHRDDE